MDHDFTTKIDMDLLQDIRSLWMGYDSTKGNNNNSINEILLRAVNDIAYILEADCTIHCYGGFGNSTNSVTRGECLKCEHYLQNGYCNVEQTRKSLNCLKINETIEHSNHRIERILCHGNIIKTDEGYKCNNCGRIYRYRDKLCKSTGFYVFTSYCEKCFYNCNGECPFENVDDFFEYKLMDGWGGRKVASTRCLNELWIVANIMKRRDRTFDEETALIDLYKLWDSSDYTKFMEKLSEYKKEHDIISLVI